MTEMQTRSCRRALIVLGMHRSGTSAMTGVLGKVGARLPNALMPATEYNAKGYFESDRITALNEELFHEIGLGWDRLPPVPDNWRATAQGQAFQARAQDILVAEFGASALFVLKDPRLCRLLPFWQEALHELGCDPAYVCIHRDPQSVAASLLGSQNKDPQYGLMLWLQYVLEAEQMSRSQPRVYVSYDRLMQDWRGTIATIDRALQLDWLQDLDRVAADVEDFLSDSLRHFQPGAAASSPLPIWVKDTYQVLERWAADGEDQAGAHTLDRIRTEVAQAGPSVFQLFEHMQDLWLRAQEGPPQVVAQPQPKPKPKPQPKPAPHRGLAAEFQDVVTANAITQAALLRERAAHQTTKSSLLAQIAAAKEKAGKLVAAGAQAQRQSQADAARLQSEIKAQESRWTRLKRRQGKLQKKLAMKRKSAQDLQALFETADTQSDAYRRQVLEVEQKLAICKDQLAASTQELGAVRASSSWRITAPLRRIALLLKALRPGG